MTDEEINDAMDRISDAVAETLERMVNVDGLPENIVLAAAHGHCVALICARYGGEVAAECARRSVEQVRLMPPADALDRLEVRGRA